MLMNATVTADYLEAVCAKNIIVIGDVMLDRFIDGLVERISPEAPVPVLSKTTTSTMPGGAANVARNLCQLGINCTLYGLVGDDEAAQELRTELAKIAGLQFVSIADKKRPTTTKTRFRASAQQILRVDEEIATPIADEQADKILTHLEAMIGTTDLIILSDYAKGCLTAALIAEIIKKAKKHDITVIVDPKSSDFGKYKGASLLTPNLSELKAASTLTDDHDDEIGKAAHSLCQAHDIDMILTTLSARGMRLISHDGQACHIPSIAKDVFDVSGAGDTVIAILAAFIAAGAPAQTAMIAANMAASIVVSKPGTAALSPGELIEVSTPTIQHPQDMSAIITKWRSEGAHIGFTNGCFDLLHPGHLHSLREAAKLCDKLIVGLNDDASVKRLKGASRPIQSESARAMILSHLPFIDAVMLFSEDTPANLIEAITPDILIKGGDYSESEIVGADHVIKNGGKVKTIPLLDGHSTTAILEM